ncbi:hypothetical protein E2C01_102809 [Portunus trituberculatus]|uniref:Uncharacterized protein n=1 Tax=Portunus trituberculatus TaxID=210409 RepID=A0A5B7KI82_PORTR|nr:hypothetical protein [Portunus trituberculatus]
MKRSHCKNNKSVTLREDEAEDKDVVDAETKPVYFPPLHFSLTLRLSTLSDFLVLLNTIVSCLPVSLPCW